ncbi:hypothetical protein ACU8KH_05504 [Lachancea thermotolerans]
MATRVLTSTREGNVIEKYRTILSSSFWSSLKGAKIYKNVLKTKMKFIDPMLSFDLSYGLSAKIIILSSSWRQEFCNRPEFLAKI